MTNVQVYRVVIYLNHMAKAIDTLKAAALLTEAGLGQKEAEAIVELIAATEGGLVTKTDLALLESRLTNRIYAIGLTIAALVVGMNVFF